MVYSSEEEICSSEDNVACYENDLELPLYSRVKSGYTASKLANILMAKNIDLKRICHIQPLGVTKTATFIVDLDDVLFNDLKADDLGVWSANGTKSTYFTLSRNGVVRIASKKPSRSIDLYYTLTRRYYTHGTYKLFRRIVIDIRGILTLFNGFLLLLICLCVLLWLFIIPYISYLLLDSNGQRNKYSMIQYLFEGPDIDIKIKPHGNSKEDRPFFRTAASTKERIKHLSSLSTPTAVISKLTKEKGGEIEARGIGTLPRDRRQVSYARQKQTRGTCDPLYSIMLECKLAQGTSSIFVQDVKAAPHPMSVCCYEWQLQDMVRFLTSNYHFTVLSVDTTYKLGEFYVTPMAYHHLMVEDIKTKKHPVMLGPLLVHQKVDFTAFNYFVSTLIGLKKELRNVLAFGSDGDKALVEALSHNFPYAIQLRCFLHFQKNVEQKLKEFGIPTKVAEEFIYDIFGHRAGNTYQEGLVDCCSIMEFDERVKNLKPLWDSREKPYAPTTGPRFYNYFIQYQADVVCYHMRKDLRESAGLGLPPAKFTTNASESLNAAIKRKVDFKESDWPQFISHMKQYVESQREEVIRSLSGRGQYRLLPIVSHYGVPTQSWIKMTPEQRREVVTAFENAKLPRNSSYQMEENLESAVDTSSFQAETILSVSAEDSGIISIPLVTLSGMWNKASELLSTENAITPAPGCDKKARMVLSHSQGTPHHIRSRPDGQYLCDNNCPQWMSSQICSHTLAVAEQNCELLKFLEWHVKMVQGPNYSSLALSGLPRGRGQKGGRPKRLRAKSATPTPDNVSLRPGFASVTATAISGSITQAPLLQVTSCQQPVSLSFSAVTNTACSTGIEHYPPDLAGSYSVQEHSMPLRPPPLINIPQQNVNPFFLKQLSGNIRVCQGCRGSLRLADGSIPGPPYDVVVAHLEKRPFRDPTGAMRTPSRASAAHYHVRLACLRATDPSFVSSTLVIPPDLATFLTVQHKELLLLEFGLHLN